MIKAIETIYNGYRFRSRLEARWAVFFDFVGVPFEYESEGFECDGERYLPDFHLPIGDIYLEIKASWIAGKEFEKVSAFARNTPSLVGIVTGAPFDEPCPRLGVWMGSGWEQAGLHQCPDCGVVSIWFYELPLLPIKQSFRPNGCKWCSVYTLDKCGPNVMCECHMQLVLARLDAKRARFEFGESG